MKRIGNLYPAITGFNNVLTATRKARKGKRFKPSTALFELNLEKNIFQIMDGLINKTYKPGIYRDFYIHDPKQRLISAAPYFDRVVHHALINVIEPVIGKGFIFDSYACMTGKGTHKAVQRYNAFKQKNLFVLKCDIRKYFQSIDHQILFEQIERKIKCKDTLWLIQKIIGSRHEKGSPVYFTGDDLFTPMERKKGIPIGNLTSQFFSNLYLDGFDHFVKETLRARYYIRYCDDFVIFDNSKEVLNRIKEHISDYLETLRLRLHQNKSRVYRVTDGVDFLGYRIFSDHLRVRKTIVRNFRRKLKTLSRKYKDGTVDLDKVNASVQSWIGHVQHANSYRLREELFNRTVFSRSL